MCGFIGITLVALALIGGGALENSSGHRGMDDHRDVLAGDQRVLIEATPSRDQELAALWILAGAGHAPGGMYVPVAAVTERVAARQDVPAVEVPVAGAVLSGRATHYGESYNGQPLGCGTGDYSSLDATIVAVGYANFGRFPCGSPILVCGAGGCINATRQDACPGCDAAGVLVDLSEAALDAVCGAEGSSSCQVEIR